MTSSNSRKWFWLLLLIPVVAGFLRLRFDVEVLDLLPPQSSVVQGLKLYQQHFANARELIVTVKSADPETTENTARALALGLRTRTDLVTRVTWQPPWMENPIEASELTAYLWLNQSPAAVASFSERLSQPTNVLAEARERMATSLSPQDLAFRGYDPYGLTQLPESATGGISTGGTGQELFGNPEGTFHIVFVEAKPDLKTYRECIRWLAAIRSRIQEMRQAGEIPASIEIHYTGRPAFVAEIAGGMEQDMASPSIGTLAVIALLFYLTHRRWKPLFWLLTLLIFILALTVAAAGLFFGTLNVVSLGFASILLGLAEDFGIVLYQESRSHPALSAVEVRREASPGIIWSTITTAGAFFLLNLSGLPGLGQLGSLVGIGIVIAALVMLFAYLPPLLRSRKPAEGDSETSTGAAEDSPPGDFGTRRIFTPRSVGLLSVFLFLALLIVMIISPPSLDHTAEALRPQRSEAYVATEEIKRALTQGEEPLWIIIPGQNEAEVLQRLKKAENSLNGAVSNQQVAKFTLPTPLWPSPENQAANRPVLGKIATERTALKETALAFGFSTNALALTDQTLGVWSQAARQPGIFWPSNSVSRWILDKVIAHGDQGYLALGFLYAKGNGGLKPEEQTHQMLEALRTDLEGEGIILSGWPVLSPAMFRLVQRDFPRVFVPMLLLLFLSLWLAFRSVKEVFLSLLTLIFSGLLLIGVMRALGWSWNLMNLMALPLLLGMGVDFSIHMQLALQRYRGDLEQVRRTMARALLLAGSTTVAGFASLIFSTNAGIISLGKVCAVGIACSMIVAIYLLPAWWALVFGVQKRNKI